MPLGWSQSYATTDASNAVTFNFTGVINALGLMMATYLTGNQITSKIRWVHPVTGLETGALLGSEANEGLGLTDLLQMTAEASGLVTRTMSRVNALSPDGLKIAQMIALATDAGQSVGAYAGLVNVSGVINRTVMDSLGRADFPRLGALANTMIMGCRLNGTGAGVTFLDQSPLGGITACARAGAGVYTLTHAALPLTGGSGLVVASAQGAGLMGAGFVTSATTSTIAITNPAGAGVDGIVDAIIMG